MAVRPIDGNELYRIEKLLDTDIIRQDKVALNLLEQVLYDIQHVPTLAPPNEWVAVEERLPEYNPGTGAKSYWVAKKDNAGNWQMKIAQYCDYGYAMTMDAETEVTWRDWDFTKIANVTHWMPLPAPPGKGNNVPAKAPNEPLSLEQLREMDGEPVYVVFRPDISGERSQSWALVNVDEKYGEVYLVDSIPGASCYYDEIWADLEGIYRRPPEGEEDT